MRGNVKPYYLHDIIASMDHAWDSDDSLVYKVDKMVIWCFEHRILLHGSPNAGRYADGMTDNYGNECKMSWTQVKKLAETLYRCSPRAKELRKTFLAKVKEADAERREKIDRKFRERVRAAHGE